MVMMMLITGDGVEADNYMYIDDENELMVFMMKIGTKNDDNVGDNHNVDDDYDDDDDDDGAASAAADDDDDDVGWWWWS